MYFRNLIFSECLILISSVSEVCMEVKVEVLTQLHMKY